MDAISTMIVMAEFLIAAALFGLSHPRRKLFVVRTLAAIGVSLGLAYLLGRFLPNNSWFRFLNFFLQYLLCSASIFCCFKTTIMEALFLSALSFATQHFAYNLTSLVGVWWSFSKSVKLPSWYLYMLLEDLTFKAPIYVAFYFLFARRLGDTELRGRKRIEAMLIAIFTVLVCIGITRFARDNMRRNQNAIIAESLYAMVCCLSSLLIALYLRKTYVLEMNEDVLRHLLAEEKRQLELKKENAEYVHYKYHDLQKRLQKFDGRLTKEEIGELSNAVRIYDSPFKTGNKILDIILTSINQYCINKGVSMTFLGDGSALDFLEEGEMYSIIENAFDNAIEAVLTLPKEDRQVSATLHRSGDLVSFNVVNYFQGNLKFEHGLPKTSHTGELGFHGYGMVSMKRIAEKYQGGLSIDADGKIFSLTVFLIRPAE